MAKRRLNITVDHETVERARRYSRRHNTSISYLVEEFLSRLPDIDSDDDALSPSVKGLLGIARGGPGRDEYRRHLVEKYGQ